MILTTLSVTFCLLLGTEDVLSKKPEIWPIIKIVIPRIKAKWVYVAYSLQYEISAVKAFKNSGEDGCVDFFTDWLTTNNGVTPKTWRTLLNCIKDVAELQTAAEKIEEQIMKELS